MRTLSIINLLCVGVFSFTLSHAADNAGRVKTLQGSATIERAGKILPVTIGMPVLTQDTLRTGQDGSVGITLQDGTRLSAGKNASLKLNQYQYNPTTHAGTIDASLNKGAMAVISGKIAKASPETVQFRTQHTIIGVRGTEFMVEAGESL